jgi:catechol 2,3-dioxygenase-like lactoylglutathione lyase family enzyme
MNRFLGDAKLFHVGHVVRDVDEAVERMLASGIGPFYFARGLKLNSRYRGQRHDLEISAAFACAGGSMFELVAQHNDVPSAFKEHLARFPSGGLHHIAYYCNSRSFDAVLEVAAARGMDFEVVQEFLDRDDHPLEIYVEPKGVKGATMIQFVLPGPFDAYFDKIEGIAAQWDGTNPKRNLTDLFPPHIVAAMIG